MDADVIIAGAGPAGCAAAIACRAAGLSVVLLYSDAPVRSLPWESMALTADGLVRMLGLESALGQAARGRSSGVRIAGLRPTRFAYPARQIDRAVLDRLMLNQARRQGAILMDGGAAALEGSGTGVFVRLGSGDGVVARWAIDATGRRRALIRKADWPTLPLSDPLVVRSAMITSAEGDIGSDNLLHFTSAGWLWHTRPWRKWQSWTALQRAADPLADDVAAKLAISQPGSLRTLSATWDMVQPCGTLPLFAVGDAMGSIDPASGTGLFNALSSALAAARAIAAIRSGDVNPAVALRAHARWCCARIDAQALVLAGHYEDQGLSVTTFARDIETPSPLA